MTNYFLLYHTLFQNGCYGDIVKLFVMDITLGLIIFVFSWYILFCIAVFAIEAGVKILGRGLENLAEYVANYTTKPVLRCRAKIRKGCLGEEN